MKNLLCIIFLAYCRMLLAASTYSGDFSAKNQYNTHGPYEFTGKGTNKALLQFMSENTSSATPVLMYVKPPIFTFAELYFSTFQHSLFNDSQAYDQQHANAGQRQIINVGGLTSGKQVFIYVINFNSTVNPSYTNQLVQDRKIYILWIVFSVLGGLFVLSIFLNVICAYPSKRFLDQESQICPIQHLQHPRYEVNPAPIMHLIDGPLNKQELYWYLSPVLCNYVLNQDQDNSSIVTEVSILYEIMLIREIDTQSYMYFLVFYIQFFLCFDNFVF